MDVKKFLPIGLHYSMVPAMPITPSIRFQPQHMIGTGLVANRSASRQPLIADAAKRRNPSSAAYRWAGALPQLFLFGSFLICNAWFCGSTLGQSIAAPQEGWSERIERALKEGKADEAIVEMSRTIDAAPKQARLYLMRGSLYFRSGKIEESIKDFDTCVELDPDSKPYLWQRGIALYYAKNYEAGREQFDVHRGVNPNDVENAFWHFLCAVKLDGLEQAQKGVLLSGFDRRIPMMRVQELIQGKASPEDVIRETEKSSLPQRERQMAKFYGYLYVALYYDALDDRPNALRWLQQCVDLQVEGYMGDVAKIHLDRIKADQ